MLNHLFPDDRVTAISLRHPTSTAAFHEDVFVIGEFCTLRFGARQVHSGSVTSCTARFDRLMSGWAAGKPFHRGRLTPLRQDVVEFGDAMLIDSPPERARLATYRDENRVEVAGAAESRPSPVDRFREGRTAPGISVADHLSPAHCARSNTSSSMSHRGRWNRWH
jgi:hypothetical protein